MSLTIGVDDRHDASVISLDGELDLASAPDLADVAAAEVATGQTYLIIDLSKLTFCDSAGLRVFVRYRSELDTKGGRLVLAAPQPIVRRVLDPRTVGLWFPGNREALEVNAQLKALQAQQGNNEYVVDTETAKREAAPGGRAREEQAASKAFAGDDFTRSQTYTQPRTIVLNTRYDGAVAVDVWMRPCDSVSGTRWTRWVPPSNLNTEYAPSPRTSKV